MVPNELLIRTINAAQDARERGFFNTADAFDEIVENLLDLLNQSSPIQSESTIVNLSEKSHVI